MEQPLKYHNTVNTRKSVVTLAADAEFGSNIVPASVSGKPASLSNALNSLFVLQDVVKMTFLSQDSEFDKGKIFFSTFISVSTVSDFILRKVRGLLMVISLDCTKLELIAEENSNLSPLKSKVKASSCRRKKKGRSRNSKKLDPVSGECVELRDKSVEVFPFTLLFEGFVEVLLHMQCLLRRVGLCCSYVIPGTRLCIGI